MVSDITEVVKCSTFEDFVSRVRPHRVVMDRVFRGQQNCTWKLQSVFDRWHEERFELWGSTPRNYNALFDNDVMKRRAFMQAMLGPFKREVERMPHVDDGILRDDMKLWALGRHHGLMTPLLDWSESPYVAAFFAFFSRLTTQVPNITSGMSASVASTDADPPVAVWEIYYDQDTRRTGEFEIVSDRSGLAHRQLAQAGLFTMLVHPSVNDVESYYHLRNLKGHIRRYEISWDCYQSALSSLRLMNIRYGTLFPDLDGAAVEANLASFMATMNLSP
jgi:hypothetical protein